MRCLNTSCENQSIIGDDCSAAPYCEGFEFSSSELQTGCLDPLDEVLDCVCPADGSWHRPCPIHGRFWPGESLPKGGV